jgi:hypothetical protein
VIGVSRAIMAERERCETLVRDQFMSTDTAAFAAASGNYQARIKERNALARVLIAAIRKGGE